MTGSKQIIGRVLEIGNIEALGGRPGIVIEADIESIRDFHDNLFGARVSVARTVNRETAVAEPTASKACGYCGGKHSPRNCTLIFRPIEDCEHADTIDGTCAHPKNLTPECHVCACPRIDRRLRNLWDALVYSNTQGQTRGGAALSEP